MEPFVGQRRNIRHADGSVEPITVASVTPSNQGPNAFDVIDTMGKGWLFSRPEVEQVELAKAA